jgi:alpha-1,6-mannosyltransferase
MVAPEVSTPPAPPRGLPVDPTRRVRRLGLVATLMMAFGALGAGALPVPNPLFGQRIVGLPGRNVTLAIAVTYCGIALLVLCWLWVAKMLRSRGAVAPAPTLAQLARTTVTWALPLAIAPPLFSRDVYSYLAQSATLARGIDPYVLGPAAALGVDDPLTRSIPTIWRDTPAPYGPLFLSVGRVITALTGDDVVLGIFAYRVLAVAGLAMIVWAVPRLAKRCGVDTGLALWLGVGNPLVLFHLISGIHNESLMLGLFLAGMEIGLRSGTRVLDRHLIGGAFLIVCASAVKLPAMLLLGFLGLDWARRRGGRAQDVAIAAGLLSAITVLVYLPLSLGTGTGLGFTTTLAVPSLILSWMSTTTDLGLIGGQVGVLGGLGDHTDAVLSLFRGVGLTIAGVLCVVLLWRVLRGTLEPVTAMAAGLGAVVLLGPVVHPWYVLWGLVPLAATRAMPRYRRALLAASAVLAVVVPPTGADFNFRAFQLPIALIAAVVMLVVLILVQRRMLAGREGVDIDALPGHSPVERG